MLSKNLSFLMESFYNLTGLPIRYCETDGMLVRMLPNSSQQLDPYSSVLPKLLEASHDVQYVVTEDFLFYGKIDDTANKGCFIIGPGYNMPLSQPQLTKIMVSAKIAARDRELFTEWMSEIPLLSFEGFLNALSFLNFALNRNRVSVEQLLLRVNSSYSVEPAITTHLTNALYHAAEAAYFHNTYNLELQIITYVRNGERDKLAALFENSVHGKGGPVAKEALRQEKNIFIVTVTLVTRAAIEGGLNIETAFHLSDIYIQQAEGLSRIEAITLLRQQMVLEFADRVAKSKYPANASLVTLQCMQYVKKHINSPILLRDISEAVGFSASYISKKFAKEMGVNLNDYINAQKIQEAKNLLAFTNKSLSEISSYLCFSSQSYFQNLFKKIVGMTPMQYRNSFNQHKS
ncbi:hypothetical protein J40TS1_43330 [Paenibacillus montaniterrae]|uniref:HTH araC/xylS-type domain-containing protein n=1 Tax=Paenibacillus montaniterrae TaxID=429341 RepID=A0A919YUF8_9BACL|nr:AraC family transcriptional regulator [Paenibacillus montaniterrae]GIP18691.1 hypothetical protein J40TS1_43330 [Paenibacillus montaniterrae]